MTSLDNHFKPNLNNSISNEKVVFSGENFRISVLSERLVRLEYSPSGLFSDAQTTLVKNRNFEVPQFKVEQDDKFIVINTKYFMLQYLKNKPFLGPKFAPDSNLKVSLLSTDKVWFYGQVEARNFKGGAVSLDNYEGKINLDKGLYSTDGFVLLDDSSNLEIDEDGSLKQPHPDKVDLYLFMYKRDFGLCLKDYFTLTGYPDLIPKYALGIWWNRERVYSFEDTKALVKSFERHQIPLSVLLLSEFWHIKDANNYNLYRSGYSFNKNLFPNPQEFIDYMHNENVKIGLNFDPIEGVRKEEDKYVAFAQSFNISDGSTVPFNVMDKEFMALYVKYLIEPLSAMNIDIYWIDYKKDLLGLEGLSYYYNKSLENVSNSRTLVLTRSPLVAPHKAGILYSGETIVSWDTLKYLPFYNSLAANKGVTWWSHDVGGYKGGIEDSELYIRYIQFSTFNPIFRFSAKRGYYYKREPWMWDVKTFTIARDYCLLRQRLIPYIYTEAYYYSKIGRCLINPIYYSYPEVYDEPLYRNEYYFGKSLFIAPITKPKDKTMNRSVERVFLPEGTWYDFQTGKKFTGNKRYVVFYKEEEYPIFAASGSIIPLANLDEKINDTKPPKSMEINVFPGKSNVYKLYEDDGITKDYLNGKYMITAFDYNYLENNHTLIIRPLEGDSSVLPSKRNYKIRFRNTRKADEVILFVNEEVANLEYKAYEDANDFVVDVKDVDTTKQLTINCKGKDIEINAVRIINEDINSIINDLKITTKLKEEIANIFFSNEDIKLKRIRIRKLKELDKKFIKMFIKLLEYIAGI